MSKVIVIYNKKSGGGQSLLELKKLFLSNQVHVDHYITLKDALESQLKDVLSKKTLVIAAGGDGTVSAVASLVVSTPAIFTVIPTGTLNNFAKDTSTPLDLDEVVKNIKKRNTRMVDVACVNGQIFVNNSSLGIYARSLRERNKLRDRISKWPAAAYAVLKVLINLTVYNVTLDIDNEKLRKEFTTPFVFIGNNAYTLKNFRFTRHNKLNTGQLSIYAVASTSRREMILLLFHFLKHSLNDNPYLEFYSAKTATIKTRRKKVFVSYDGEYRKVATPLSYQSKSQSLRIISHNT